MESQGKGGGGVRTREEEVRRKAWGCCSTDLKALNSGLQSALAFFSSFARASAFIVRTSQQGSNPSAGTCVVASRAVHAAESKGCCGGAEAWHTGGYVCFASVILMERRNVTKPEGEEADGHKFNHDRQSDHVFFLKCGGQEKWLFFFLFHFFSFFLCVRIFFSFFFSFSFGFPSWDCWYLLWPPCTYLGVSTGRASRSICT